MGCRWLLSWKNASGEEPPGELALHGQKAEARLVVIGLEDPQVATVKNDAPTLTKDGIVLQHVSNHRWPLLNFDISTAFLHGEGDGRNLGLHPAPEIREAQRISALSMEERTVAAMRRICGTAKSEMSWSSRFASSIHWTHAFSPMAKSMRTASIDRAELLAFMLTMASEEAMRLLEPCWKELSKGSSLDPLGQGNSNTLGFTLSNGTMAALSMIRLIQIGYIKKIASTSISKSRKMTRKLKWVNRKEPCIGVSLEHYNMLLPILGLTWVPR